MYTSLSFFNFTIKIPFYTIYISYQATLIHQSLFKFLHVDDHKSVKENLLWIADYTSEINEVPIN